MCSPQQQSVSIAKKVLIVDDHELILRGITHLIQQSDPTIEICLVQTAHEVIEYLQIHSPELVIVDLSIPATEHAAAEIESGVALLQQLMQRYPQLNIVVQSSYVKALVRIMHEIDSHQGGFTIADKALSNSEILSRIQWSLQGITHTKDLRTNIEVKPEWLQVLQLAFNEGLQDKAIAERMSVAERTIRHYWTKIQDVLDIYPDQSKKERKNIRIETEIKAREVGLID